MRLAGFWAASLPAQVVMYGVYTDMSGGVKAAEKRLRALLEPLQAGWASLYIRARPAGCWGVAASACPAKALLSPTHVLMCTALLCRHVAAGAAAGAEQHRGHPCIRDARCHGEASWTAGSLLCTRGRWVAGTGGHWGATSIQLAVTAAKGAPPNPSKCALASLPVVRCRCPLGSAT